MYRIIGEKGILELASEHIKDLWRFVFVDFSILNVAEKLPLLKQLKESNDDNLQFVPLIEKALVSQQMLEISKIYTRISLKNIDRIVPFSLELVFSVLLLAETNGTIHFKYDEEKKLIEFKQKSEEKTAYSELNRVAKEIALIAEKLNTGETTYILKKVTDLLSNGKGLYEIRKNKIADFLENLKKPKKEAR